MTDILFDIVPTNDAATRSALHEIMHDLKWRPHTRRACTAAGGHEPVVVIGNAGSILDHWSERVDTLMRGTHKRLAVFAIIEDREDEDAFSNLVTLCNANRLLLDCKVQRRKRSDLHAWQSAFERIADAFSPDRIRTAFFADGDVVVAFGDGFTRTLHWDSLPFAKRTPRLVPESLRVSEEQDAIVVDDAKGREVDIDALALRSYFDQQTRTEIETARNEAGRILGERLRKVREQHGLTQEQLATRAGIPQESLSRIETGSREPRVGTLAKYASGLGLTLPELLAGLSG